MMRTAIALGALTLLLAAISAATASGSCNIRCDPRSAKYYRDHPSCRPSTVAEPASVTCASLSAAPAAFGDLYTYFGQHYNVLGDRYYFARMAEALGYQCATNTTMQAEMRLMTPWSGIFGAVAIDGGYGFDRSILRRCVFPTADGVWPFLCTGARGTDDTCGEQLGTLSYNSLLHDQVGGRWNLFGHCWNAATPANPGAVTEATSWNVFSLDPVLSDGDKALIIAKLASLGFNVNAANIVQPNFTSL